MQSAAMVEIRARRRLTVSMRPRDGPRTRTRPIEIPERSACSWWVCSRPGDQAPV